MNQVHLALSGVESIVSIPFDHLRLTQQRFVETIYSFGQDRKVIELEPEEQEMGVGVVEESSIFHSGPKQGTFS
ncbi:hypothetical protein ACJIZ3_024568 [Penstemon smallii]|uniref:Uncharacterized protein n=1 Tax=Penstemon smallii TaxID=265156 RepID=A0ABD3TUS2_9LAMI